MNAALSNFPACVEARDRVQGLPHVRDQVLPSIWRVPSAIVPDAILVAATGIFASNAFDGRRSARVLGRKVGS